MTSKVTSIRADDPAPGKVIPVPASVLQKLADSLVSCMTALAAAEGEQRDAAAILAEVPPAPYDHAAGGQAVAQSRVSDLLNGGSTAAGVQQRCERDRAASAEAAAAFAKRQADAQAQAERAGPMISAARAQALELDRAVRAELAKLGSEMETAAAQALADAACAYSNAFVGYRAVRWLQQAEVVGERGRQFATLNESDLSIFVPNKLRDCLPAGWTPTPTDNFASFGRYDLAVVVGERRRALMEAATSGVYPQAAAGLHRDQAGGES